MKFELGIILFLAVAAQAISQNERDWQNYKEKHDKKYNPSEEATRKSIFSKNKELVEKHNEQYLNGEHSYNKELNKFSDWLPHEKARLRGFKMPNVRPQSAYTFIAGDENGKKYIDSIDWRTLGAVTPVKDQGKCKSSWAFSATGSMEGQQFMATSELVSLSEQNLLDCDHANDGCKFGAMDSAFDFVKYNGGIDTEDSYPYLGKVTPSCNFNSSNIGFVARGFVDIVQGNEVLLERAVTEVGPISAAVNSVDLADYASGIYNPFECSPSSLDLGVLIVGYGITSEGNGYWILKNSWGADWGEDGYFRLARGFNKCGIADMASYPCYNECV